MSLTLHNTRTRQKEVLAPITPGRVGIYYCGPTVYSEPHLGHARGAVVFDVLRRWLEAEGYAVRLVVNVTDVGHLVDDADQGEDKLLVRAKLERLEPMEVAEKYFWSYFDALAQLNVRRPDIVPRATGHIPEQLALTEELIRRGLAYERGAASTSTSPPGSRTANSLDATRTNCSRGPGWECVRRRTTPATSPSGSGRSPSTSCVGPAPGVRASPGGTWSAR